MHMHACVRVHNSHHTKPQGFLTGLVPFPNPIPAATPPPDLRSPSSPPGCMVEGRTFSPAESDTKKANGIIHRQNVK